MQSFTRVLVGSLLIFCFVPYAPVTPALVASINVGCNVTELIDAINGANAAPDVDTLELAADCTYSFTEPSSIDSGMGNTALPIITTEITIHGNNATIERVNSDNVPDMRLLRTTATAVLSLHEITLYHGKPSYPDPFSPVWNYDAGAILNLGGQLFLSHTTLRENTVIDLGGAIYNVNGSLIISDSLFEENHSGYSSAGINNDWGNLDISSTVFRGNDSHFGSAINNRGGTASIRQSTFENNIARKGNDLLGIPMDYPYGIIVNSAHGTLVLEDSVLRNNTSDFVGTVVNFDDTTTILRSTFSGNKAELGGAVWNHGELSVDSSTFTGNAAFRGGAVHNRGKLMIGNSTFAGNDAYRGGAIWSNGELALSNSTLTKNTATFGAGVFNHGTLELWNDTFVRNDAVNQGGHFWNDKSVIVGNTIFTRGKPENCFGAIETQGGNLRFPARDGSCAGAYGDPKLGPLGDNSGPTHTMALEPGSEAINRGTRSICLSAPVANLDQRGIARIVGNEKHCDSGAYEVD